MYVCRRCQQWLPLEAFVNRQRKNVRDGRDGACKTCATDRTAEELERAKAEEVAKHFYEESRGQVDGRHRKVKNSRVSLAAAAPSLAHKEEAIRIYASFAQHCDLRTMDLEACMAQERGRLCAELAALKQLPMDEQLGGPALSTAAALRAQVERADVERRRISGMHALTYSPEQALQGERLTDFISTVRGKEHGAREPLQVCCDTQPKPNPKPNPKPEPKPEPNCCQASTTTCANDVYELGTFSDAPGVTNHHPIKYCSSQGGLQLNVTSMGTHCVVRHVEGTIVRALDGTFVGMRLPEMLSGHVRPRPTLTPTQITGRPLTLTLTLTPIYHIPRCSTSSRLCTLRSVSGVPS